MRLFCRLCGARTDGQERLGTYCPGNRCGTDLRTGNDTGVQAWCEPERVRGEPGRTATVRLMVRNSGSRPDTFRVEPVEQVDGRLDFDAAVLNVPLAPDQTRVVEIRYTLPRDRTALGIDVASRFGVPGADAAGRVNDGRAERFGVALRVVSTTASQGAAGAAFAVDVPARFRQDRQDGRSGGPRARSTPMLVGGGVMALIVVIAAVIAFAAAKEDDGGADTAAATPSAPATVAETAPTTVTATDGSGGTAGGGRDEEATGENPSGGGGNNSGTNGGNNGGNDSGGRGNSSSGEVTTPPVRKLVRVPNVTTLPDRKAVETLQAAGFKVELRYLPGTGGPRGLVQAQQPGSATMAPQGSAVVLSLRDGKVKVPDVIGMTPARATAKLEELNLVGESAQSFTADRKVVSTDPAQGTLVDEGSTVILYSDY
ncbi:PASTA domain-containing protein [Yinghuangia sp. YIM S09857]|uniref:PASTA domain-containing protein n=1 Tax=Yinghuangia sp. YIM S09857 TaxID=3436929 RepID=UPI003F533DA8